MTLAHSTFWQQRRSKARSQARRRRGSLFGRFQPQVSSLEERQLLASNLFGPGELVNAGVVGVQKLTTAGGRSIDVGGAGTILAAWTTTDSGGSRIVARRTDLGGAPLGAEIPVSTTRGGTRGDAVVASNGQGQFVVAWESRGNAQDRRGSGVIARTFAADGTPLSGEFLVNASVAGNQGKPSVDWISPTQFVVTWSGAGQGRGQSVFARVFDASGNAVTGEVRVPATRAGGQQDPAVVSLPDGGFQVAWSGRGPGGANRILSRQFDGAGNPTGPELVVNTSTRATVRQPTIDRDGDQVLIAWQADRDPLDRSGTGVLARRYSLGGTALGSPFLVNQTTRGRQSDPSVAFLSDGGFVAAWQGSGAADADGVFAREFNADGTPRGDEKRVNSTTAGAQAAPSVLSLGEVQYAVAFDGHVAGDNSGVDLSTVQADVFMPGDNVQHLYDVFFVGDANYPAPPMKTISLYNNTPNTIYPVLENANAAIDPKNPNTSLYDPRDAFNNEYRGYIGYEDGGQVRPGLLPGQRIDIQVPLVFWNAGTIQILTTPDIFKDTPTFTFHDGDGSKRLTQPALGDGATGRVMWYHAPTSENFGSDAPSQLVEYTIRDAALATWAPNVTELVTLINYDVSYVQDMMLPVAVEAANVPIPNNSASATYGWVGANLSVKEMQDAITEFTTDAGAGNPQTLLGLYFNGKGFDQYYLPNPELTGFKIPANDKTFGLSPFGDVVSTYDSGKFMLASGGNVFQPVSQGSMTLGSATVTGLDPQVVSQLAAGMLVKPDGDPPVVPQGTTILKIGQDGTSITLSAAASKDVTTNFAFVGSTPPPGAVSDYVVTKMTNLWYSWAGYYAANHGLPAVPYADQTKPSQLAFATDQAHADAFAGVVYDVMTAFAKIPITPGTYLNATSQLMQNIIGCNVAKIPGVTPERSRELTIEVQSLLRGVVDHRVDKVWYPNPADKTPGATENGAPAQYNLYNLDPFVWFVHERLKLSGYGFSVDDDTADVGANLATQLLISVGGVSTSANFPMNAAEWSSVAPWGPVSSTGSITDGSDQLTGLDHVVVNQVNGPDPNLGVLGAIVTGPGIQDGTTILTLDVIHNTIQLSKTATKTLTGQTYTFRGPNQQLPTT